MSELIMSSRFSNKFSTSPRPSYPFCRHDHFFFTPINHKKMRDQDDQTRVFYQLCSMIINILTSPPLPIPFPTAFLGRAVASSSTSRSPQPPQVSPTAFAALFIGISFAFMLFGSAIFVIGFMLMPWVIALVMLFYLAAIVSNLVYLAGAVLCPSTRIVSAWQPS